MVIIINNNYYGVVININCLYNSKSERFGVIMKRTPTMLEGLIDREGGLTCINSTFRDQLMGCTNSR